jgi:hypothetical protein
MHEPRGRRGRAPGVGSHRGDRSPPVSGGSAGARLLAARCGSYRRSGPELPSGASTWTPISRRDGRGGSASGTSQPSCGASTSRGTNRRGADPTAPTTHRWCCRSCAARQRGHALPPAHREQHRADSVAATRPRGAAATRPRGACPRPCQPRSPRATRPSRGRHRARRASRRARPSPAASRAHQRSSRPRRRVPPGRGWPRRRPAPDGTPWGPRGRPPTPTRAPAEREGHRQQRAEGHQARQRRQPRPLTRVAPHADHSHGS